MTGRVLSEEEVQLRLSQAYGAVHSSVLTEAWHTEIQNLIVTIRDRDKTIAVLHQRNKDLCELIDELDDRVKALTVSKQEAEVQAE